MPKYNVNQTGCFTKALAVLKGLTQSDLKKFLKDAQAHSHINGTSMEDAIEAQSKILKQDFIDKQYHIQNQKTLLYTPKIGLLALIKSGKASLKDLLSSVTLKIRGGSVESTQNATLLTYKTKVYNKLSPEAQAALISKKIDRDVMQYRVSKTFDPKKPWIPEISKAMDDLVDTLRADKVSSGVLLPSELSKFRYLGLSYEFMKVAGKVSLKDKLSNFTKVVRGQKVPTKTLDEAKSEFVDFMMNRANLQAMFDDPNDTPVIQKAFEGMFDHIIQGHNYIKQNPEMLLDLNDIRKKQTTFFIPKDDIAYSEVVNKYGSGDGSLYTQMMNDMENTAKAVGMARVLGFNPNYSFSKLLTADGAQGIFRDATNIYKELNGYAGSPARPLTAQIWANIMSYDGLMGQVGLTVTSINDTNMGIEVIRNLTKNPYIKIFLGKLQATLSVWKSQALGTEFDPVLKKMFMNMRNSLILDHGALGRQIEVNNVGNLTRKMSHYFYKFIGMEGKDAANRASAMGYVSGHFGGLKDTAYNDLDEVSLNHLKSFGISEPEWELLRKNTDPIQIKGEEFHYLGADSIDKIPDSDMADLAKQVGEQRYAEAGYSGLTSDQEEFQKTNLTPDVSAMRSQLGTKVYAMLEHAADETVLFPTALERAIAHQGQKAGSLAGDALRAVFQFKAFMISYINRVLINGFKQDSSKWKYRFLLANFLYTVPLTYIGNVLYNAANGYPLKADPLKWGLDDWFENLVPGIAMITKALDPREQDSNLALSLIQSPTTKLISDMLSLGASTVNLPRPSVKNAGKKVKSHAAKVVSDLTPLKSLPYASGWWRKNVESTKGD